jgi:hypothetical protein
LASFVLDFLIESVQVLILYVWWISEEGWRREGGRERG